MRSKKPYARIIAEMRIKEAVLRDDFKQAITIAEENGITEKEFAKLAREAEKAHK